MEKTILIYGREKVTKDGRKFMTYSYVHNDKWYEVKFTRKCEIRPMNKGYYDLTIDTDKVSIEKSTRNEKEYLILWIRELKSFVANEIKNKELQEKREKALADVFD